MDSIELEQEAILNDSATSGILEVEPHADIHENIDECLSMWKEKATYGLDCLKAMTLAKGTKVLGQDGELSLVELIPTETPEFIHWDDVTTHTGQIVLVDDNGGVKARVYIGEYKTPKSYSGKCPDLPGLS